MAFLENLLLVDINLPPIERRTHDGGVFGLVYLTGEEQVVDIVPIPLDPFTISPFEALMMISQAKTPEEIGEKPIIASVSKPESHSSLKLYEVEFGRDSLETSITLIDSHPSIARRTILSLSSSQGLENNPKSEEEFGKIIHENRDPNDVVARKITENSGWEWPYYGAVDPTPLFIQLIGLYVEKYGSSILDEEYVDRKGQKMRVKDAFARAVIWLEEKMDETEHGLIEFKKVNEGGIENKVWRDSKESHHHKDGHLAKHRYGIASFSVQVDAYKAFQAASLIQPERAEEFANRADYLRKIIFEHFWIDEGKRGYFALASERQMDDKRRLLSVKTSDMGHVLDSDILASEEPKVREIREKLIRTLFSPEMLCDWGIRSLASDEVRFTPGGYHNGSVWPRETIKIARGLQRLGYYGLANELHRRNLGIYKALGFFPELVRGENGSEPGLNNHELKVVEKDRIFNKEQPAQPVQAWTVAAMIESERILEMVEKGDLPDSATNFEKGIFEQSLKAA